MTPRADVRTADPAVELHACLDRIVDFPVDRLGPSGQAELVRALTRAEARITALRLRVLAEADRSRTAARVGAATTGQWAASLANTDQARRTATSDWPKASIVAVRPDRPFLQAPSPRTTRP